MPRICVLLALVLTAVITALTFTSATPAQTVWSGYSFSFTKASFASPLLPENQDRMTGNVWLTRDVNQGIFNIHDETSYTAPVLPTDPSSPMGTEWATDLNNPGKTIAATNWSNLTFFDGWVDAYGGQGTSGLPGRLIGRNAVVHLITDDIYLDLRFTDWAVGGGGGFAYDRAVAPAPPAPTGDYNHNGIVDGADYVVWRDTLNQAAAPPGSGADGNANGTIDDGDYTFWRSQFGNVVPGSAASNSIPGAVGVPEPAAATILIGSWPLVMGWRARRGTVRRTRLHQEKGPQS